MLKFVPPEEVKNVRGSLDLWEYVEKVMPVVKEVKARGLEAVKKYNKAFDNYEGCVSLSQEDFASYSKESLVSLFEEVLEQLSAFHKQTAPKDSAFSSKGVRAVTLWRPVERLGAYVPGGLYPYPSTALMTAGVAKALGVKEVTVATPPKFATSEVMASAFLASKVDSVLAAGGAHGVSALAYVAGAHKVVGPGGPYVQAAKLLVSVDVPIDMIAGPTELAVIADSSADPEEVAYDMLAQAEHGPTSFALLVSTDEGLVLEVEKRVKGEEVEGGLYATVVRDLEEAKRLVSELAPEHVSVYAETYEPPVAGAASFKAPSPFLDYSAGPNHVLPTSGWAKARGPLGPVDFMRWTTLVEVFPEAADLLKLAAELARLEGMKYHAKAIEYKLSKIL
ncbi:histidinol dehydrogenase [Ignicoccus hospitalis]|uniref:histidinol dehydrogenase n=1 Tax=Ignicoccus hospitalis TaxID=160233 RepID=UPI0011D08843|nr:histidinol dehydrogenase [Ignicoccus hospitalis]HIH90502.1 histidinol dehydrogenase [Desulfurococcaceae archaeon]